MPRHLAFAGMLLYCLLYSCFLHAQPDKEALIKDLDEYRDGIVKNHVHPFSSISRKDFYQEIENIKTAAPQYNRDELVVALLRLDARIDDEHTSIILQDTVLYPFGSYWFEEGIYITHTDTAHKNAEHFKICAVNNIPIDSVTDMLAPLVAGNKKMWIKHRVPSLLADPLILHGLHITDSSEVLKLTVVTKKSDTLNIYFEPEPYSRIKATIPISPGKQPAYKKRNYWYEYDTATHVMYFDYKSCYDQKDYPFATFQDNFFKEVDRLKPDRIIIDMRENGGGKIHMLKSFINQLQYTEYNKKGKLFVLIGRHTFSAAVLATIAIKRSTKAIIAGEESGGSVNLYTEVLKFTLPHTHIEVMYSTQYYTNNLFYEGPVLPDIKMAERFSDYVRGKDALLDYVKMVKVE